MTRISGRKPQAPPEPYTREWAIDNVMKLRTQYNAVRNKFINFYSNARKCTTPHHKVKSSPPQRSGLFLVITAYAVFAALILYQQSQDPQFKSFKELSEQVDSCDNKLSIFCVDGTLQVDSLQYKHHLNKDGECGVQFDLLQTECSQCHQHLNKLLDHVLYEQYVGNDKVVIGLLALLCAQLAISEGRKVSWLLGVFLSIVFVHILAFHFVGPWIMKMYTFLWWRALARVSHQCHARLGAASRMICPAFEDWMHGDQSFSVKRQFVLKKAVDKHVLFDGRSCLREGLTVRGQMGLEAARNLNSVAVTTAEAAAVTLKFKGNKYWRLAKGLYGNWTDPDIPMTHKVGELVVVGIVYYVDIKLVWSSWVIRGIHIPGVSDLCLGVSGAIAAQIGHAAVGTGLSTNEVHELGLWFANAPENIARASVETTVDAVTNTGSLVITVLEGVASVYIYVFWQVVDFEE